MLCHLNHIISPAFGQLHVPFCFVHVGRSTQVSQYSTFQEAVEEFGYPPFLQVRPRNQWGYHGGCRGCTRRKGTMAWRGKNCIHIRWMRTIQGRSFIAYLCHMAIFTNCTPCTFLILLIYCQSWRSSLGGASVSKDSPFFGTTICQKVD